MDEYLGSGYSLVVGSGLSGYDFGVDQIVEKLKKHFKVDDINFGNNLFSLSDDLIQKDINEFELRSVIKTVFENSPIDPVISKVASRPWRSIISLSYDGKLIEAINFEISKRVTARRLSVLTSQGISPAPGSIPFYALLGSITDERPQNCLCITQAQYLKRRRDWRNLLKSFPDYNKASSLVFMGTSKDIPLICDLINELLSLSPGLPSKLIFFKGDPCAYDPSLRSLLPDHVQVQILENTLRKWLEIADIDSRQLSLPLGSMEGIDYKKLASIGERLHIVPRECDLGTYDSSSLNRVIDYLFKPSELNWEPYRQNLDFPRDITRLISERIDSVFSSGRSGIVSLSGETGVGKTVVMRRLAYDLSNAGCLSLWVRRNLGYQQTTSWASIARKISESTSKVRGTRVVIFFDGAITRFDQLDELVQSIASESIQWCLVLCRRKTDEAFGNDEFSFGDNKEINGSTINFPNILSEAEMHDLPQYLLTIRAAPDIQAATHIVLNVRNKNASDVLCAFWYILPQTRSAIAGSLSDEYC